MKHVSFIALVLVGATAIGAGAVMAKPGGHGPRASFEELDADKNGEVTQVEMETMRTRQFAKVDTDGDGKLTLEEITAHRAAKVGDRAARMLERFDANKDGALSQDELPGPKRQGTVFERLDADKSGGISREEFQAARQAYRKGREGKWGHHHKQSDTDQN